MSTIYQVTSMRDEQGVGESVNNQVRILWKAHDRDLQRIECGDRRRVPPGGSQELNRFNRVVVERAAP